MTTAGSRIIWASWIGTGVFVVTAAVATFVPDSAGTVAAIVSLALFTVGCLIFLWAYAIAVQRSRSDLIGIGGLYFLAGTAPNPVRLHLLGSLAVESVVAVVTASIRLYSPLAFGILVPVYGLGLCGLWAARHGTFAPRPSPDADPAPMSGPGEPAGKNAGDEGTGTVAGG